MVANEVFSDPARIQLKCNPLLQLKFVKHEMNPALAGTGKDDVGVLDL